MISSEVPRTELKDADPQFSPAEHDRVVDAESRHFVTHARYRHLVMISLYGGQKFSVTEDPKMARPLVGDINEPNPTDSMGVIISGQVDKGDLYDKLRGLDRAGYVTPPVWPQMLGSTDSNNSSHYFPHDME